MAKKVINLKDTNENELITKVWLPVGTLYYNKNDITEDIKKHFCGTWERVKGFFPLAVDESDEDFKANKTGGEKTHRLTVSEMPKHTHSISTVIRGENPGGGSTRVQTDTYQWGGTGTLTLGTEGGDQPHNNMPPYRTFYAWIRVS